MSYPVNPIASRRIVVVALVVLTGVNALVLLAPGITWDHRITIRWDNNNFRYDFRPMHDGFPGYQIRVNGAEIYTYDPICDAGGLSNCGNKGPLALSGSMDEIGAWISNPL